MKIRLSFDDQVIDATLVDTHSARDFYAQLPMSLTLDDYAKTEKIAYLPKTLSEHEAPAGFAPSAGDIAYYAPWGNLAIFYRDFGYSTGLIELGSLDGDAKLLASRTSMRVHIEPVPAPTNQ